jgi:hypothetical protein
MASTDRLLATGLFTELEDSLRAVQAADGKLYESIVEAPFDHTKDMALIFLGFICYFSMDTAAQALRLEAATHNEYLSQAMASYDSDGTGFVFPLTATDNSIVQAALTKQPVSLSDWDEMRRPGVEAGVARLNQATSGIAYTLCMPVADIGVLGFNFFQSKELLPAEAEDFARQYTDLVARILSQ